MSSPSADRVPKENEPGEAAAEGAAQMQWRPHQGPQQIWDRGRPEPMKPSAGLRMAEVEKGSLEDCESQMSDVELYALGFPFICFFLLGERKYVTYS